MFAALHLPALPVMAALRLHASLRSKPCAVLAEEGEDEKARGKLALLAVNDAAHDAGIEADQSLARARVRCPDLIVLSRDPGQERKMMEELLELAETLTPDLEVTSDDVLLLDLSRAPANRTRSLQELQIRGAEVVHVRAETPDLAHLGALHPDLDGAILSSSGVVNLPLSLLWKIAGGETFLSLLELWGLKTLGEFMVLPRQDLTERLGCRAGHWQDVLHGKFCRLLRLHRVPESLEFSYDFEEPQTMLEPVVFLLKRLLHGLSARVGCRHLAVGRLYLVLRLESGERMMRSIGLPEPLVDAGDLLRPLQTLLESLSLACPVIGVDVDADAAQPTASQRQWFSRQLQNPRRWSETLARVEALVGLGKMGIPVPSADHRPDAFRVLAAPLTHDGSGSVNEGGDERRPACALPLRRYRPAKFVSVAFDEEGGAPRPLALLTGPHPGPIVDCHGPFPMSGHWWDAAAGWYRLEWDIELADHQLMRLAYVPPDRWQLEGIYL